MSWGYGAEIAARIANELFWLLDAPVGRVCTAEVPIPYAKQLEEAALPQVPAIVAAVHDVLGRMSTSVDGASVLAEAY